jgi:hypothetical protein
MLISSNCGRGIALIPAEVGAYNLDNDKVREQAPT